MKKYFTTSSFKRFNKRAARRSLKTSKFKKKAKKARNAQQIGKKRKQTPKRSTKPFAGYDHIDAPSHFSLIGNTEAVLHFISRMKRCFDERRRVKIVMKHVNRVDYDAIVLLTSIAAKFKNSRIAIGGDLPLDPVANETFRNSGFFKMFLPNADKRYTLNDIHTHAWNRIDGPLSARIIEQISQTVWGEKRRSQGVYRTLIELMLNTNNHASLDKVGEKHWWLSVNHYKEQNKVCCSFVDYGVGVFTSLENKKAGNKFYGALNKMIEAFQYQGNAELLKLILTGELHKTVTGKSYRGKGLPGIYESFQRNFFSNLHVITNNVHANIDKGIYKKLNANFAGTFIYWEITPENRSNGSDQD